MRFITGERGEVCEDGESGAALMYISMACLCVYLDCALCSWNVLSARMRAQTEEENRCCEGDGARP